MKKRKWTAKDWWTLAGFVVCIEMLGIISGVVAGPSFYSELNKPGFAPPGWLFGPVWTALYALMAIAVFLVWRNRGQKVALWLFAVQMALNIAWSPVFFGMRSILGGLVVITLLWFALLLTILRFWRIDRRAGLLLIPYILWVSFALMLNLSLWMLN